MPKGDGSQVPEVGGSQVPEVGGSQRRVTEAGFREAAGHFATGVVVITGRDDEGPVGFTAQSFTSVSLDPPLISICPGLDVASWARMAPRKRFCVNVLADDQEAVSRTFATKDADKFDGIGYDDSACEAGPVIDGGLAWFSCRVVEEHVAGDHRIVVAQVDELGLGEKRRPLIFFRGGYAGIAP